ncbi:DinB family protein [Actinomadura alba]|uniref:DinB family protein n=1 Tax=Actinomadura alba TaxID=406431 RepID=A0ABR7LUV1_9ACTN|nr:DinB family protein [Actinomadura alba]MBC6468576.1 DinB family protein [Actinomadura alba]
MTGASVPNPKHYSATWSDDTRITPPDVGDEREILSSVLDWHRATFELKCAGIPRERLSECSVPPSSLSLHGLVRHLAGVERWWFRQQFAGEDLPMLYYSDDDPDQDFDTLDGDVDEAFGVWRAECERSRQIVAAASLDDTGIRRRTGEPISLRRIMVHLIAEYARHLGHADLLRERIDGSVGA